MAALGSGGRYGFMVQGFRVSAFNGWGFSGSRVLGWGFRVWGVCLGCLSQVASFGKAGLSI